MPPGLSSPYDIIIMSNQQLAKDFPGSGTSSDPFRIEDKNLRDLSGNGMLVSGTDVFILIRDITTENLSGSSDYPSPVE